MRVIKPGELVLHNTYNGFLILDKAFDKVGTLSPQLHSLLQFYLGIRGMLLSVLQATAIFRYEVRNWT